MGGSIVVRTVDGRWSGTEIAESSATEPLFGCVCSFRTGSGDRFTMGEERIGMPQKNCMTDVSAGGIELGRFSTSMEGSLQSREVESSVLIATKSLVD